MTVAPGNFIFIKPASVISKQDQTITFPAITTTDLSVGTIDFDGFATSDSGLSVTYSVHPNDIAKASFSGTTLTLLSAGDVTILANQAGDATYNAAPQVSRTLTITDTATANYTVIFKSDDNGTASPYTIAEEAGTKFNLWGVGSIPQSKGWL